MNVSEIQHNRQEFWHIVGKVLATRRTNVGWSQVELAQRAGVSAGLIAQYEGGKKQHPGFEEITRVTQALGMPIPELINEVQDQGGPNLFANVTTPTFEERLRTIATPSPWTHSEKTAKTAANKQLPGPRKEVADLMAELGQLTSGLHAMKPIILAQLKMGSELENYSKQAEHLLKLRERAIELSQILADSGDPFGQAVLQSFKRDVADDQPSGG